MLTLVRYRLRCQWFLVVLMLLVVEASPAASAESQGIASGRSNYEARCASCHGASGKGDGWRTWLSRLQLRDFTDSAFMQTLSDEYLFQIIKQGGASIGKPGMPSWGQKLTDLEIKDLVAYIRSLAIPARPLKPAGATRYNDTLFSLTL